MENKNWSFSESYIWGNTFPKCKSKNQSPINIDTELVKECKSLCNFELKYKNTTCLINNANNLINIKCSPGSYFLYENTPFELTNITIHTPSLHTLDGTKSDVEICLIHKLSSTANSEINGIVLSRLFEKGPNFGDTETFINQIINDIPSETIEYDKEINVSNTWGPNMILPQENLSYFTYNGSLHHPPCTENYKWFIYEDIGTIGTNNIETLKTFIGNNIRPIQPIQDRTVFYVVNREAKSAERKMYFSDNKYLKCMKHDSIPDIIDQTEKVDEEEEETGINKKTLRNIKQMLFLVVVIIIFINAFFIVKYLYKHFMWQKILKVIAGDRIVNQGVWEEWTKCASTTSMGKRR
jgi:carbonic anhydrase